MHDLHSNEVNAEDGVWLTPSGTQNVLSVKSQQHAMQCDALADEIRLVRSFSSRAVLYNVVPSPNFFCFSCQNPSKFLNLTFRNGQIVIVKQRLR
jgi:hypothetical protein